MKIYIFTLLFTSLSLLSLAQGVRISGQIRDINDQSKLIGASALLINTSDSTKRLGVVTDTSGTFQFDNIKAGVYKLRISFLSYVTVDRRVQVRNAEIKLGEISLVPDAKMLKDVVITGKMERVTQKGDTLVYNASAFKTNPDANAEDLIAKMPNMTIENGKVKAQGEDVRKVTVDGREFFGDDAALALKNLPAEIIDKIEVFDKMSDQAQFTGFDDGNSSKSINIVTRSDRNNGQFGKFYAGAGTDNRYAVGGNTNYFKKATRISVIGQTNNVNQQNFAMQDLLGALGGGNTGGFGGGMSGGGGRSGGGGMSGGSGMSGGMRGGGGNSADNFMVGQQNGISTTHALGVNYSDQWGRDLKISGSYFYNQAQNLDSSKLSRNYFTRNNQVYNQNSTSANTNWNHRLNLRLEYTVNKNNSIIFTPNVSFQDNNAKRTSATETFMLGKLSNKNRTTNTPHSSGFNASGNLLWRHRFAKEGRTFSTGITVSMNDRKADNLLDGELHFYSPVKDSIINQRSNNESYGKTISAQLNFTEPLNEKRTTQLQLSYNPTFNINSSDKLTNDYDSTDKKYNKKNINLSNVFDNTYFTNRGGVGLRFRIKETSNLMIDLNVQNANLNGQQIQPRTFEVNKSFTNLLPSIMFFSRNRTTGSSWRINYRTSTNAPSINQLQNVINNNNPTFLSTGNPDLIQEYSHSGSLRYGITNPKTAQSFFINFMGNLTSDNITTATILASRDTTIQGFAVKRGTQFSRPINVADINWNIRSFVTFGMPISPLKANLNFNGGVSYSKLYGLINNIRNTTVSTTYNGGLVLSSSQSERFDYTLSYSANYILSSSTGRTATNNNYFSQNTNVKINWLTKKGFFLNSNTSHSLYSGLSQSFNQSFWLWNASVGQKFWKRQSGELRLSVFDVLGQNNSVSRNITETYLEDSITNVLQRYYMLTFTYTLRNFR